MTAEEGSRRNVHSGALPASFRIHSGEALVVFEACVSGRLSRNLVATSAGRHTLLRVHNAIVRRVFNLCLLLASEAQDVQGC